MLTAMLLNTGRPLRKLTSTRRRCWPFSGASGVGNHRCTLEFFEAGSCIIVLLTNDCRNYQLDAFIKSIGGVHGPEIIFEIEPDRFCGNGAGRYAQVDSLCERRRSDEVANL